MTLYKPASLGFCCCVCDAAAAAGRSAAAVSMFSRAQRRAVHASGDATLAFEGRVGVFLGRLFWDAINKRPTFEEQVPISPALKSGTTEMRTQIRRQNFHVHGHMCMRAQSHKYRCLLFKWD